MPTSRAAFVRAVLATVQKSIDSDDTATLQTELQALVDDVAPDPVAKSTIEVSDPWWDNAPPADDWWASSPPDGDVVALKISVAIDKGATDPVQRKVWGWASVTEHNGVPVVDSQNDIIDSAEMQRAVHDWIMSDGPTNGVPGRTMGDSHRRIGIGKICDSMFFTDDIKKALNVADRIENTGWYIGAHVDDDATWEGVASGRLKAFSIGARAFRSPVA